MDEELRQRENEEKKTDIRQEPDRNRRSFLAGAAAMLVFLLIVYLLLQVFWLPGGTDTLNGIQTGTKIRTIEKLIDEVYVGDKDEEQLVESMYRGMISGLGDPYANYYTEEEYQELSESQEGYYEGIGITLGQTEEGAALEIMEVQQDTPADQAGIQAGDVLKAVNGTDVSESTVSEAAQLIRTAENETVTLTLQRDGEAEPIQVEVKRERLETETVAGKMLDESVGYLAISEFTRLTPDQFRTVFGQLQEEGMQKLLVDLRGNPGGLLTAVCDTLRQILPEGLIVYTEDKQGNREEYTSDGETPLAIPMVVLVNGDTASAAEIFSGAVKDYGIGTIVGTQTYGKGIVQDFYTLPDQSVIKLTVAHYYTPKGNDIHGVGIEPDVKTEQPEDSETDVQLQKAIEVLNAMEK